MPRSAVELTLRRFCRFSGSSVSRKVCARPGCPAIVDGCAYRGLCPEHRRHRERERGTRTDRGYGSAHQVERARLAAAIDRGDRVECWRCHQPIKSSNDLHLGHDDHDRTLTRGAEHALCNLTAAGKASHATPS